ncbi:50S ribosomal protein L11 methyltransferase, partial [Escherichia coli]|uniref:Orn/Lys/Arg family decarboxylase n=1 Tax=Escherichia coli TaxID=562 RepID=UPI0035287945
ARWLAARPQWVRDKRVLDFGSGSGVAAIAAARAGAAEVVACDLDPLALAASRANAELNGVELSYSADFFAEDDRFDLILVADVLYDRANLPLLDVLPSVAQAGGKRYNGVGLRDLSDAMHASYRDNATAKAMKRMYTVLPEVAMRPSEAYDKLVRGEVEAVPIARLE